LSAALVLGFGLAGAPAGVSAQPTMVLKVPPFEGRFPNFASIVLPESGYETLEVLLESANAPVQPSTVRLTINEVPLTPFVAVNPMPLGIRAIVRLKASLNPDYAIRREGETILTFMAADVSGVSYRAQFYLVIDPSLTEPQTARTTRARQNQPEAIPPPQHKPPVIVIRSEWPVRTSERTVTLQAEVSDDEGLRRVVIEVNGRDVEEIALQNERPVRKKDGRIARGKLPGEVSGDGYKVTFSMPVRLERDRVNVVAVRAESILGLSTRVDRVVEVER
jgi:hypothetical protein